MMTHAPLRPRLAARAATVVTLLFAAACAPLFGPDTYRLEVTEVDVPAEMVYGESRMIHLRYNRSGCEVVDQIRRARFDDRVVVDVRGRVATVPANAGCPDVLRNGPDSVKVPLLPPGEYEVWTMRVSGDPFVSSLVVLPPGD